MAECCAKRDSGFAALAILFRFTPWSVFPYSNLPIGCSKQYNSNYSEDDAEEYEDEEFGGCLIAGLKREECGALHCRAASAETENYGKDDT